MKQLLSMIAGVVIIVSLAVSAFTYLQVQREQASLLDDLEWRTALLADSFKESIRPSYLSNATGTLQGLLDKFAGRERLLGLAVYDNKTNLFMTSAGIAGNLTGDTTVAGKAMDADSAEGGFAPFGSSKTYVYASPLHQDEKVIGALVVFQRADYINTAIREIWKRNFQR